MKKKIFFGILGITILLASFVALSHFTKKDDVSKTNKLNVFVLSKSSSRVVVQDSNNLIYTFNNNDLDFDVGSQIVISYTGVLSNTSSLQKASIVSFLLFQFLRIMNLFLSILLIMVFLVSFINLLNKRLILYL